MKRSQDQPYHLKKTRISSYQLQFKKLKTEFLHYKWVVDMNAESGGGSLVIKQKLEKVSKLLFDIEADFEKHKRDK